MTTLLLNSFLVLLVILFGAMAYYPLFMKSSDTEEAAESWGEDIVISVAPSPMNRQAPVSIVRSGRFSTRDEDDPNHPGHRPAA